MPLINSNTLNEFVSKIPNRARGLYSELLDAPRQIGQLFNPSYMGAVMERAKPQPNTTLANLPEEQKQKLINLGMDVNPVTALAGAIRAFHGSPHKFDKFDMSKIGTGEGAQAYGHGLYFAESPEVANDYYRKFGGAMRDYEDENAKRMAENIDSLKSYLNKNPADKQAQVELKRFEKAFAEENNSSLYEVNLRWPDAAREASDPLGPQHFLDYSAHYENQPSFVKNLLEPEAQKYRASEGMEGAYITSGTGEQIWKEMVRTYGSPEAALKKMQELKVPGMRYLDQGSRVPGEGTYNYVIFDDQIPEILTRNGLGLMAPR